MLNTILSYVTWDNIASVVLAASLLAKGIEVIVALTPGKGDDKFVAKIVGYIAKVKPIVDKLAINPKAPK